MRAARVETAKNRRTRSRESIGASIIVERGAGGRGGGGAGGGGRAGGERARELPRARARVNSRIRGRGPPFPLRGRCLARLPEARAGGGTPSLLGPGSQPCRGPPPKASSRPP